MLEQKSTRVTMQKIVAFVLVLVAINYLPRLFRSEKSPSEILKEYSVETNKTLPQKINSEIRFDSVGSNERNIHYNLTFLNLERENVEVEKLQSDLRRDLLNTLKGDAKLKAFREHDVMVSYIYNDKNKEPLCRIDFKADQY